MILSGILEFVLGNTFPSVVFLTFGAFWLTFAGTLNPGFAAYASFAADGQAASTGLQSPEFNASFGMHEPFSRKPFLSLPPPPSPNAPYVSLRRFG